MANTFFAYTGFIRRCGFRATAGARALRRVAQLDTGTLESITAVAATATQLVVGTSGGSIRGSDDAGLSWRRLTQLPTNEAIIDIDRANNRWLVLAATIMRNERIPLFRCANEIKVYSALRDLSELSFLRLVTVAKAVPLHGFGGLSDPFVGVVAGSNYYVNAVSEISKLDTTTMQWSALKPSHEVTSFQVSGDPGVVTALLAKGGFSKVSASFENGATWSAYNRPPYVIYDVRLTSADQGEAARWNLGAFTAKLEFLTYEPTKKVWLQAYDAPLGCKLMLRDADFSQRFCLTSGGSILAHQGDKWVAEFAVQ
jgi:hypothetical protein